MPFSFTTCCPLRMAAAITSFCWLVGCSSTQSIVGEWRPAPEHAQVHFDFLDTGFVRMYEPEISETPQVGRYQLAGDRLSIFQPFDQGGEMAEPVFVYQVAFPTEDEMLLMTQEGPSNKEKVMFYLLRDAEQQDE